MDPPLAATQAISASPSIESVLGRRCRRSIVIEAEIEGLALASRILVAALPWSS
jgi:hypothetical protein